MELTKEYFDEQLDSKIRKSTEVTKEYLDKKLTEFKSDIKQELKNFPTKDDLKEELKDFVKKDDLVVAMAAQTQELKNFAREQTEELAQIIATTIANPLAGIPERVTRLEQRIK